MAARDVALALTKRFLQAGSYVLAGTQGRGPHGARPAAVGAPDLPEYEEYGFSGLAVQSVGVEEAPTLTTQGSTSTSPRGPGFRSAASTTTE